MDYTEEMIRLSAKKLDLDLKKYDMEQIKMGMAIELEHGSTNSEKNLDVTGDDPVQTLQIVLAHLEEEKDYYTKLKQIEEQPEEEHVEERYKLFDFSKHSSNDIDEDGEGGGPAVGGTSLAAVPGMGAPVIASRTADGSGDVPSPPARTKKRKKKRVKDFDSFTKK